jgi:hypothetical protein
MRSYIKEWFKKVVNNIANEGQRMLETVLITTEEIYKRTLMSK